MNIIKKLLFIIFLSTVGIYSLFIEPNKLDITNYTIQDKELSGIKIVFASDFHINPKQQKRLEKVVELINEQNADLVLSAGDFVYGHTENSTMHPQKIADGLSKVKSKYGYYTTLGNHDGWYSNDLIQKALENNGIKVLNNENIKLKINNKELYIAGIEDLMTGRPDIEKALENTCSPTILLTHTPDMFTDVPNDVNLTLAGHTHGGQVRVPFFGALFTASRYGNRYAIGLIEENGKKLITTRGIGVSLLPIRFNCPPEIVVIHFVE